MRPEPSHDPKEPVVWNVVERKLGPAGGVKERTARQRRWDDKYGADAWAVGYVVDGAFVLQEQAYEDIYVASYDAYFGDHPADLDLLCTTARTLRNPTPRSRAASTSKSPPSSRWWHGEDAVSTGATSSTSARMARGRMA